MRNHLERCCLSKDVSNFVVFLILKQEIMTYNNDIFAIFKRNLKEVEYLLCLDETLTSLFVSKICNILIMFQ